MARWFRLWEKKRGTRRTGSKLLGSVGEALFFVILFLLGSSGLVTIVLSLATPSGPAGEYVPMGWGLWLVLLVAVTFVLVGGGGVIYTVLQVGTSAERRAAIAKRAADFDLIRDVLPSAKDYPSVPRDANLTNSPGTTLAYRLPIAGSPAWKLFAAALFCLLWNAMVSMFLVLAVRSHVAGRSDWYLTAFAVVFLAVGVWSIYYFLKELVVTTWIGPTIIEISELPLYPGGRYEIHLTQSGQFFVRSFRALLVCEEETTYLQGTDVRNDSCRTYQQSLFHRRRFVIRPGRPLEQRCILEIPREAMHSFRSDHNAVQWKLVVEGDVAGWSEYERVFPLVVYPADDGKEET